MDTLRTDPERVLDQAEEALERGEPERALELCDEVLAGQGAHAGALYLAAEACRDLRLLGPAELRYRHVVAMDPDHSASWSGLAAVLFDQLQFQEARSCAARAIRQDPCNPEAYVVRGLLRERRGDHAGAMRDLIRANRLDPDAHPRPLELDDATIEAVVQDAIQAMHPTVQDYLQQVAVVLEEVPDEELCRSWDPPAPPAELLGYFSGYSLMDRALHDPWSQLPSMIVLFRRNLERIARDRDTLIDELRVTVFHEVGHFLGLNEEDLEARGLD